LFNAWTASVGEDKKLLEWTVVMVSGDGLYSNVVSFLSGGDSEHRALCMLYH
jgi:hypothetical protein